MEYVNIMEAARRCGVHDKTIRRAIHKGTLPAHFPQPNRCEIAVADLEHFPHEHVHAPVQTPSDERIAALERRVQALEQQVQQLLDERAAPRTHRPSRKTERTTGPLPKHLVPLLAFAALHNVSEQKVLTHVTMDVPLLKAVRGEWTDVDGTVVTLALDAKGRAAFYRLYNGVPPFAECRNCPH